MFPSLTCPFLLTLVLAQPGGEVEPPPPGLRAPLSLGKLFIPDALRGTEEPIQLIVHLHGSADVLERQLQQSQLRAVLVTVSLKGLSSVYTQQFQQRPESFLELIHEAEAIMARHYGVAKLDVHPVTTSSFSAGFGGVRELLKSPECYRRIDRLVMADSIYAGYDAGDRSRGVDPALMDGFIRFARDALAGRKQMIVSHCQLQPEGYASTAETADYLLRQLNLERQPCGETWSPSWHCNSRCERSGMHVFSFAGDSGADHLRHLQNIGRLWVIGTP